jgi:hypothetical protein
LTRSSLTHAGPYFNPIRARTQRRKIHQKHVNEVMRISRWLYAAARWNQKQGNYKTALALMAQMTDGVAEA